MACHAFRTVIALASLCAVVAAQRTWIVDHAGGGQFTEIQPAIAAAQPGDRLVVRPSPQSYLAFTLNKGLDIEGQPSSVTVDSFTVQSVASSKPCRA